MSIMTRKQRGRKTSLAGTRDTDIAIPLGSSVWARGCHRQVPRVGSVRDKPVPGASGAVKVLDVLRHPYSSPARPPVAGTAHGVQRRARRGIPCRLPRTPGGDMEGTA